MAIHPIFQIHAELNGYEPKIWRLFQVANNTTVARLGYILMTLFEMKASHLFCFEMLKDDLNALSAGRLKKGRSITPKDIIRYDMPSDEPFDRKRDIRVATQYTLKHAMHAPESRLFFRYDYGDDWFITVTLKDIIQDKGLPGNELPRVLDGAGFGIVEDCGGVYGLKELRDAFKKKKGEVYDNFREWLGVDNLDLESFDLDDMNFRLKKIPRIFMQSYEQELYPTKQSIDLLERKYLKK